MFNQTANKEIRIRTKLNQQIVKFRKDLNSDFVRLKWTSQESHQFLQPISPKALPTLPKFSLSFRAPSSTQR